jgi:glutathione S-transferase
MANHQMEVVMKLYYSPGACSLAPHILLRELGKKFDLEKVDLGAKKTEKGSDFWKVNSKGYVPTLEIKKGENLTEVATILQYLADKAKATRLLPKPGSMARYRTMETLNFVASELHKGIGGLFNPAMPDGGKAAIKERVSKRIAWLDGVLAKSKFVNGKTFSVVDPYAFTVLGWCRHVGIDLSQWKNVDAYLGRIASRPAVQAALKAEGLIK